MADKDPITLGNEKDWFSLIALGKDAWNLWARNADLEKNTEFELIPGDNILSTNFDGFEFPGNWFIRPNTSRFPFRFENTTFYGNVVVQVGEQEHFAHFTNAKFHGKAEFNGITFKRINSFRNATFLDKAIFSNCSFSYAASFRGCEFRNEANFSGVSFELPADFSNCVFDGEVLFERAVFRALPIFTNASFNKVIPNFRATHFASQYPPDLHHTSFVYPTSDDAPIWDKVRKICATPDGSERARILKKIASDGHNHDEEMKFFAMEMKAKRKHEIRYDHPANWPKLALNHGYEFLSGFGQSITRPAIGILATLLWSSYCYAGLVQDTFLSRLVAVADWSSGILTASLSSLIPFAGQTIIARQVIEESLCSFPASKTAEKTQCLGEVYFISAIEGVAGFVFLFLLGLSLRNLARIK